MGATVPASGKGGWRESKGTTRAARFGGATARARGAAEVGERCGCLVGAGAPTMCVLRCGRMCMTAHRA
eukprot:1378086-Prymnesium_polylepis.1